MSQNKAMDNPYNGILIINKEKGYTSNDVVACLRGILHMKKIGHTGTLDPDAEGVLPVCLGKGTKLVSLLTDMDKEYSAVGIMGITTDTEDMTGTVTAEKKIEPGEEPGFDALEQVLSGFCGEYDQVPPMYSAKKVNGKKLYELAREGIEIERKPCRVNIRKIKLLSYDFPRFSFDVCCSKGTYVRSLIRDIGEKLGTGAAMESLRRTRVSEFTLEDALTLKQVEELVKTGGIEERIRDPESVFISLPAFTVKGKSESLLRNGNTFTVPGKIENGDYRVHTSDDRFAAIYTVTDGQAKLKRMFL